MILIRALKKTVALNEWTAVAREVPRNLWESKSEGLRDGSMMR